MEQIDQSEFMKTMISGIYFNKADSNFYFCDETTEAVGPYDSIQEAQKNFEAYCKEIL